MTFSPTVAERRDSCYGRGGRCFVSRLASQDDPSAVDELPVQPSSEEQDEEDVRLRRASSYVADQLGEGWELVEPGIYRFVGHRESAATTEPMEELGDTLAPGAQHKSEYDPDEHPATQGGTTT